MSSGLASLLAEERDHLGLDEARGDRVHRHAERADLGRERLRERDEGALGRRVVRLARAARERREGRDVHDAAPAAPEHPAHERLRHAVRPAEGRVHDEVPVRVGHQGEKAVLQDGRIVHEDVDPLALLVEAVRERRNVRWGRHVALHGFPAAARGPDRLGGGVGPVREDGVISVGGEPLGDRAANAARRAGDERDTLARFEPAHTASTGRGPGAGATVAANTATSSGRSSAGRATIASRSVQRTSRVSTSPGPTSA